MAGIHECSVTDLPKIREIAYKTWPFAYGNILQPAQISYMLDLFYSIDALKSNLEAGHRFYLLSDCDISLGFSAIQHNLESGNTTKIHKLYVLPEFHGKGYGKLLMNKIDEVTAKIDSRKIILNVNRFNKARYFYESLGYVIMAEEKIPIGNGYIMDDYIMEKNLM